MGQAAIHLPDPLAKPPTSTVSADELLSQLAGEEIDRLLAAEEDVAPAERPPQDIVKVFGPDGVREASFPADSPATGSAVQPAPEKPVEDTAGEVSSSISAPAPDISVSTVRAEESPTSSAERSALDGVAEVLDARSRRDDEPAFAAPMSSVPLYLKPLELINAPLLLLPSSAREIIGKIAILTFFNAIAVLVYVLVFRRAH